MVDINTLKQHDRVKVRDTKEVGRVSRVDLEENVVYVDVTVTSTFGGKATDTIDIDPADLDPA